MTRISLDRRLQRLETKEVVRSFRCVCVTKIDEAAKAKLRPSDLVTLQEAMTRSPEDFTQAHRAVWNRWEAARAEAIQEAGAGAAFLIVLSPDECRF
jgi:hypothetical protein